MTNPAPRSFSGSHARQLLRRARRAALGTIDRDTGVPYVSAVNMVTDWRGMPVLLLSKLARHTRNLAADARSSLLISELATQGDALTGSRVTVLGRAEQISDPAMADRYTRLHPYAASYAEFADFGFWHVVPDMFHAVAGFGRIETMPSAEVLLAPEILQSWQGLEASARDHMNADHKAAARDYVVNLLGAPDGNWSVAALDPDGVDLECGDAFLRCEFDTPAFDGPALRLTLVHLAEQARRKP